MTYLTVPIGFTDYDDLKAQLAAAQDCGAEALELRLDYLPDLNTDLAKGAIAAAQQTNLPIIVTCRAATEGGINDYPANLRITILAEAAKAGADFIDCEYATWCSAKAQAQLKQALSQNPATRLILSAHNFEEKFTDIRQLYKDIVASCGEAIPKLVYTANHINDCFEGFDLLHDADRDSIVLCMGQAGLMSRIIAGKLGSLVTFASSSESSGTAPGQLTAKSLKQLYRYDSIDADTKLFGVLADPVTHSISPAVHNKCFGQAELNKLYLPLLVQAGKAGFDDFLDNVMQRPWLNFTGFSVTIPHKANALDYVKANDGFVEPLAEKIGAVNTLIIGADKKIKGYNTDYAGAMDALVAAMAVDKTKLQNVPIAVIGAGGVSRAIVAGLTDACAKVTIYNRTVEKAQKLSKDFGCEFSPLSELSTMNARVMINCTSIGMHPNIDATPASAELLKPDMVVFDTVYNPIETLLLKNAKQAGAKTVSGAEMFVGQAIAQFKYFTNVSLEPDVMRKVVFDSLSANQEP